MSRRQTTPNKRATTPATRCAIYTRKSSDEGLQQEFNSLDAQREAAEAYIASQKAEGWVCLPERFDDGGFTGGNMERPALRRLLADIDAGKVDCVVVYKVDRLSRSLMDFARIVEVFERHKVSFVSVTQHFNTTQSMGRLTLNILLSFAQFEREIIGERIRDKIAASRQKGKWTGGTPILGYDVDRSNGGPKLVINATEASRVRQIFDLYLELGTLLPVVAELERRGWRNKAWTTRDGRRRGGLPFDKCRLHSLLTNVLYVGKVTHKREVYAGEHEAIVTEDVFHRVRQQLARNGRNGAVEGRNRHGALLRGLLYCKACGRVMSHTFTTRGNRRYRYYTCTNAAKRGRAACPSRSLPAAEVERAVVDQIRCIGNDPEVLRDTLAEARNRAESAIERLAGERREIERGLARFHADIRRTAAGSGTAATAPRISAASHLLADLARQGWRVKSNCRAVWIAPPATIENDPAAEKERVRQQLHVDRLAQLREPAVRAFVREMEAKRIHGARFVSVFSLMRDGRDLAGHLRAARDSTEQLTRVIAPYLQFVEDEAVCEHTGLRLVDIWRYFRHTWANAYKSTPGRTMLILVRDAAAPMHPVMGIAALSSPAVQISVRDDWLGWSARVAIGRMQQSPNVHYARWACSIVDQTLADVYVEDFLEDDILTPGELRRPTDSTLARLKGEERDQREKHNRFMQSKEYKKSTVPRDTDDAYWLEQARTPLFRSKRAGLLADFLHVRTVLDHCMRGRPSKGALQRLLADRSGRQAMSRIIRKAKADRVGVAVAEISVCGAVQPYNAVLGGKLVAMMLTSPEVNEAYRRRYRHACSVIASSIAGRRIVRPTDLVLLGTTSLYAVGSSQYNRIRIPCGEVGGDGAEAIAYHELGLTEGYGTFHIGRATAAALTRLLEQTKDGRRVHNIFGEGVNPRLRHIRDGMAAIGFPSDLLLKHGSPRIVYAVPLARNFADFLLGLSKRPAYYLQQTDAAATSQRIAEWWMHRWLAPRIRDDQVLERVAEHTLVRPIHHGARIELPPDDPDQARLF